MIARAAEATVAIVCFLLGVVLVVLLANATAPTTRAATVRSSDLLGTVGYAEPGLGRHYLAMRLPRGTHVFICGPAGCTSGVVSDYGPSRRLHPDRIADLSYVDFTLVCGPHRVGLCRATAGIVAAPRALPPTDTKGSQLEGVPMKRYLFTLAAAGALLAAGASPALGYDGHGSDNLPCTNGSFWVINHLDGATPPSLTVGGVAAVLVAQPNDGIAQYTAGPVDADTAVVEEPAIGQVQLSHCTGEATPSAPPTESAPPTPTPTPSASPSEAPSSPPSEPPTPTPTPTITITPSPTIGAFNVAVCPATGEPVPAGQSAISIRGTVLLILLLNVRVDGQLVTLHDVAGDGSVGEVFVAPGTHTVSISNAADTEVLAEGTVDCPACNATTTTPPPNDVTSPPEKTLPPTDAAAPAGSSGGGSLGLLLALAALTATAALLARKPRRQ